MEFISNYKKYREIFDEYVSHYDNSNSMISKKISHSYRVAIHAANIAKSLDLDERQMEDLNKLHKATLLMINTFKTMETMEQRY